jgi:putative MATE family efflux protein
MDKGEVRISSRKEIERYREAILRGPIVRTFLAIGLPILVVRIVQDIYGIVDSFWLSRWHQLAVAVPRQVWPSYTMFSTVAVSFISANVAILSQLAGAGLYERFRNVTSQLVTIALAEGSILGLLFYVLSPYIFSYLVATPPEIYNDVLSYATFMSVDMVFLSINMALATIVQSLGDTRTPAISQVVGGIANVFLDPIFIMGFGPLPAMGAAGAAIATVLSKVVSMSILVEIIARRYHWLKLSLTRHIDWEYFASSMRIALPLILMNVTNSIAFNLQNRLVNTFGSYVAAAFSIGFTIFDLANTGLWGLSEGIAIMVGQNLGAGNMERAKIIARKTSAFIFLTVLSSAVLLYFFRIPIASIFISGQGIEERAVQIILREVDSFLTISIWSLPFFALTFSAMAVGRGSGRTTTPTAINMFRLWGLRIALGYVLALWIGMGTWGIYIAFALSNFLGGLLSSAWVSLGKWAKPVIKEVAEKSVKVEIPSQRVKGSCQESSKTPCTSTSS